MSNCRRFYYKCILGIGPSKKKERVGIFKTNTYVYIYVLSEHVWHNKSWK